MEIFGLDTDVDLIVIGEIGLNHEGSFEVARNLIKQASECGVNAVKLQSFTPEKYASSSNPERLKRVTDFSLSRRETEDLATFASELGVGFCSTPLSEDWVELLANIGGAIKIASGDIDFEPVIVKAATTNLPIILSTGCSECSEVDGAVAIISDIRGVEATAKSLALMHCVSQYPAKIEDCNLKSIEFMAQRYGLPIGWSNHVDGPLACYGAVSMGAKIIEVHITDKREGRNFRDHEMSFDFSSLSTLIQDLQKLKTAEGILDKQPTASELLIKKDIRKGLVAAHDLMTGKELKDSDIAFARPAHGYRASEKQQIIGKKLLKMVKKGEILLPEYF